jgi:AcrR family transcriptional regulator
METPKLSRREREKLRQRQEVLDVALRLFSEKGFHNVSMHEIAKEAEFAIGTLYKFFRNKEDLYKALILQLSDRFQGALTEVIEGNAQEIEKLRAYVRVKGELFRNNIAAIRLYFAETRGANSNVMAGLDREPFAITRLSLRTRNESTTLSTGRRSFSSGHRPRQHGHRVSFSLARRPARTSLSGGARHHFEHPVQRIDQPLRFP